MSDSLRAALCSCKKPPEGVKACSPAARAPGTHVPPSLSPGRGDSGIIDNAIVPPEDTCCRPYRGWGAIAGEPGLTPRPTRFHPLRGLRSVRCQKA